jgi:hypothetical protein
MVLGHLTRHDPHNGRYFEPQRLHADKAYNVSGKHQVRGPSIHRAGEAPALADHVAPMLHGRMAILMARRVFMAW